MSSLLRTALLLLAVIALVAVVMRMHESPTGFPKGVSPILRAEIETSGAPATPVELPHDWSASPEFNRAIYRITVETPPRADIAWSLYLPISSPLHRVQIGDTELLKSPVAPRVSGDLAYRLLPSLVRIPLDLLNRDSIVLEIEIAAPPGLGYMGPVWLGPSLELDASYSQRHLWLVSLRRVAVIGLFVFSMGLFAAWGLRPQDGVALWLSIFIFFMTASMWNMVTYDLPVPHPPTTHIGNGLLLAIVVTLVHRLHDVKRPRIERAFFLFGAFAFATRFLIPQGPLQVALRPPLFLFMVIGGLYPLAVVVREQLRGRRPEQEFISAAMLVFIIAGTHDLLVQSGILPRSHDFMATPAAAFSATLFAWIFVRRYIRALEVSEQLTDELEDRVAARERELADNYQRLAEVEGERAIDRERTRMIEELHDGTGGQIASALVMLGDHSTPRDEVAARLQQALSDMRLVLYSLDHQSADLGTLLGLLRGQLEKPIQAAGLRLVWDVREVADPSNYTPEMALNIARIVQTVVSNAIEHGRANEIALRTRVDNEGSTIISIEDDGVGIAHLDLEPPDPTFDGRGRGFVHIQRRADRIGATLQIPPSESGTAVEIVLPSSRDPEA